MKHLWHPMSETPVVYDENQQSIRLVFRPIGRPYLDVVDFDRDLLDQFQNWEKRFESWCYYDELLTACVDSKRGHNYSLRETHEDNVDGISLDDRGIIEMRHGDKKRHLFCRHTMSFCSEACPEFDRSFFDAPSFQLFACFYQDNTYIKRKQEDGEK